MRWMLQCEASISLDDDSIPLELLMRGALALLHIFSNEVHLLHLAPAHCQVGAGVTRQRENTQSCLPPWQWHAPTYSPLSPSLSSSLSFCWKRTLGAKPFLPPLLEWLNLFRIYLNCTLTPRSTRRLAASSSGGKYALSRLIYLLFRK